MLPAQHWAYSFSIGADDIDTITNLLLEKETPLSAIELATEIIVRRERKIRNQLQKRYQGTKVYRPSDSVAVGDRLAFSQFDYATARVISLRTGQGADLSPIRIAAVEFDEGRQPSREAPREFVVEYQAEHPLNSEGLNRHPSQVDTSYTVDDILKDPSTTIVEQVNDALERNPDLVRIAGTWFVLELMVDVNIGSLHLAEAVLDMYEGGPLATEQILQEIGGLGDAPLPLQAFSLNYAMNNDERFDEVGPAGQVLWHLTRLLPRMVRQVPSILQYQPIAYDRALLTREMRQLEYDLDDEHSPVSSPPPAGEVSLTLTYPHRRVGTLPINSETRYIFPEATTPRIAITMLDALDKAEYPCWVVHEFKYVYGLAPIYQKHHLPVGAYVYLNRTDDRSRIEIEFDNYRPRTEWIPLVERTEQDRLRFQTAQRAIGADYDELIIVGVSNLPEVDKLGNEIQTKRVTLSELLRSLIFELSGQNPQGTVHSKVLYSTLNIIRRCPPGPMFATLISNPDFEYVGGNYWKFSR
ncbi:MAG: hypothetical protein OXG68_14375 [Chloroflexi bacterium]|nr:hypothetical protein [Chloroflexota bacterium]